MTSNLIELTLGQLALALLPALITLGIQFRWSLDYHTTLYALARMLGQLLLVGYLLVMIFQAETPWPVMALMSVMLSASAWIALRPLKESRRLYLKPALFALGVGGFGHLAWLIWVVLDLKPWYTAQYVIPMAGMLFANSMNSVSLAAERYFAEIERQTPLRAARSQAFNAALLPLVNSLFAVGLVSLPGMMTGQILSGVEPLIAVRYQILVMSLLLGASTTSTALFLYLVGKTAALPGESAGE